MARDTIEAINTLGLKNIYLMGTSQGGMISMVIAMEYPDIVKKLVLGSTSSHVWEKQQGPIENWIKLASEKDRKGLYLDFAKEIYPPDVFEQYKGYFEEVSATVTDEELSKFVILARSIKDFNVTGDLSRISCPVLALGDFKDLVLDSDATMEIAQELDEKPDFKLYMYAGYGHAAYDTAPDYKDRVYKFLMEE